MKVFAIVSGVLLFGCFAATTLFAAAVFVVVSLGDSFGTRLEYAGGEVYYKDSVSEEEAQKFANYMQEDWSNLGDFVTFQLERDEQASTVFVRMCAKSETWETNDYDAALMALELLLQKEVFAGEDVAYELCDDKLVPQKTIDYFNETGAEKNPVTPQELDTTSGVES